jgi:quinol monooxygenase YgiN
MHVLIVEFDVLAPAADEYAAHCEAVAPAFAEVPGLISKTWIHDEAAAAGGGVYVFESREALEAYREGELFDRLRTTPVFERLRVRDYAMLEGPTRITRGPAAAVAA